jgi:hypothetical protein
MGTSDNDDLTDLTIYNGEEDKDFLDNFWAGQSSSSSNNNIVVENPTINVHQVTQSQTIALSSAPLQPMTTNNETIELSSAPLQPMTTNNETIESSKSDISLKVMATEAASMFPWDGINIHYMFIPRCSPESFDYGCWLSQTFTLLYAFVLENHAWRVHGSQCIVTLHKQVYLAKNHSRNKSLFQNPAFKALLDSIRQIPLKHRIVVFVSDINRFGVIEKKVLPILQLLDGRPNLMVVPIRQYKYPLCEALRIAAKLYGERKEVGKSSSHVNAGKLIPIKGEDNKEKVEDIKDAATDIRRSLNDETSAESQVVRDAHSRGEELRKMIDQTKLRKLAELVATKSKQVEDGELTPTKAAEELEKFIASNFSDLPSRLGLEPQQQHSVLFSRSSRYSIVTTQYTKEGIPKAQAAIGLAAKNYDDPESKIVPIIVHDHDRNRGEAISEDIAMVFVLIHFKVVDSTYMSTLVRLSGLLGMIRFALAWYKMHNAELKPFDCTGKIVMGVAKDEVKRMLALSRVNQEREDAEAAVTDRMSSTDYLQHVIMRNVAKSTIWTSCDLSATSEWIPNE